MRKIMYFCLLLLIYLFSLACEEDGSRDIFNNGNVNKESDSSVDFDTSSMVEGVFKLKNFISTYWEVGSIVLSHYTQNQSDLPVIEVSFDGLKYATGSLKHTQLSEQLGDTCYYCYSNPAFGVVNDEINSIDIVCNEYYDAEHGKGSSLLDIASVVLSSPYNYLKNGYKDEIQEERYDELYNYFAVYGISFIPHYEITYDNLLNISSKGIKFFDLNFYIILAQLPEKHGTYTFEVSIKLSQKTLTGKVEMEL